jgi:hypothetical protein
MKICSKCGEEKELIEFHRYTRSLDGFKAECKPCRKALTQKYKSTAQRLCSIAGCEGLHYGRGYCSKHWSRVYRHQDALKLTRNPPEPGRGGPEARRSFVRSYLLDRGCMDCGYKKDARALSFDHRPGTVKVRDIKSGQQLGWKALLEEIAKCDVVCMNCHVIRTSERRKEVMSVDTPQSALSQNGR